MEYGAIDLHLRRSQFRILSEDGTVVKEGKCETTRADFARVFGGRPRMRLLVESSTDSEWVAQHLESLGHEVIVADPSYAAMYGSRVRHVKTDRRDTAALAEACRVGIYRRAHRVSAARRADRQQLRIRRHLIATRTKAICLMRAILRQDGYRLGAGASEQVETRLERLRLPRAVQEILEPMRAWLATLNRLIGEGDAVTEARAATDAVATRLMTAPGVGPVVALTFEAVLDSPARFAGDAARASAFIGLVPSEDSSADRRHKGHITKAGSRELRSVLVQASWTIWRGRSAAGARLRAWAHALADRRGRRIAIVALARRLSRILFAMWRDETEFRIGRGATAESASRPRRVTGEEPTTGGASTVRVLAAHESRREDSAAPSSHHILRHD